jgi:hypothetical protein
MNVSPVGASIEGVTIRACERAWEATDQAAEVLRDEVTVGPQEHRVIEYRFKCIQDDAVARMRNLDVRISHRFVDARRPQRQRMRVKNPLFEGSRLEALVGHRKGRRG